MLTATATLTSSTRPDPSVALTLKYLGVQQTQNLEFSSVDPNKIKLTVSSLSIAPNFTREDSLTVQLSSKTGLPSQGMPIGLDAYDELYQHKLGFFRVKPATADAAGTGKFIFVLGDNTINGVNYTGTVHLVAYWTGSPTTVADTVNVFSREIKTIRIWKIYKKIHALSSFMMGKEDKLKEALAEAQQLIRKKLRLPDEIRLTGLTSIMIVILRQSPYIVRRPVPKWERTVSYMFFAVPHVDGQKQNLK